MAKHKKVNHNVKEDNIDNNYIFYAHTQNKINIAVGFAYRDGSNTLERFVYIHRCNVAIMLGLVEYNINNIGKVKWDPLIRSLPFVSRDFARDNNKGIGFTDQNITYSYNMHQEEKVPEFIDVVAVLYFAELLYGGKLSSFRYTLNNLIINSLLSYDYNVNLSSVPLIRDLMYISRISKGIEFNNDTLSPELRKIYPIPSKYKY